MSVRLLAGVSPASDPCSAFEHEKWRAGLGFAGFGTGVLLLIQSILGSAIIAMPHAFASAGYVLGVAILLFFGSLSSFTCHLLHRTAVKLGQAPVSFSSVSRRLVPGCTGLVDGLILVNGFGVMCSYLIIIGGIA